MGGHNIALLAYNEEKNIGKLLDQLHGWDIIAVIDGDDSSADIARLSGVDVFASKAKRGYGGALIDGLIASYAAGFEYTTVMDVGTCAPVWLKYTPHADIMVRYRTFKDLSKRFLVSRLAALCLSATTQRKVLDATFGYRTYRLEKIVPILSELRTNGHATNMELLGLAYKRNLTVAYRPVPYILDENSQLRSKDFTEAARTIWNLILTPQSSTSL